MARKITLEVCIASLQDALTAQEAGADRLELNAALPLGGLTPSLGGLIEIKAAVKIPVIAMVRPRPGGFAYSAPDFRVMSRDADLLLEEEADGLAFGILNDDGTIDVERCRQIRELIPPERTAVFHRAFDVTPDPFKALETLIELGFHRVMTSGQEESAYAGASLIAQLQEKAAGRIEILPAGGINRFTLNDVIERTGCTQVHGSLRTTTADPSTRARAHISFGSSLRSPEDQFDQTCTRRVAELRSILDEE